VKKKKKEEENSIFEALSSRIQSLTTSNSADQSFQRLLPV